MIPCRVEAVFPESCVIFRWNPPSPTGVRGGGGTARVMEACLETRAFYQGLPDEDLMDHVVLGSEGAFACIVDRYKNRIQNLVYRYVGDFQRAEDLAQEAFVRVYLHRERYRKTGKFSTWIFTIAVNLAKNEIRRKIRLRNVLSLEHLGEVMGTSDPVLRDDEAPSTDRRIEREQTSLAVESAIARLPKVYRESLVLRDIEGLSYEEIGEILEIPGGTVRSRINRARIMLKEKLRLFARTEL